MGSTVSQSYLMPNSCSNQLSQTCISHWTPTKPNFADWSAQAFPELICPFTNLISPKPATHPATPGWHLPWTSLHQMTKPVLHLTNFQQVTIGTIQAHDLYNQDQVQTSIKDKSSINFKLYTLTLMILASPKSTYSTTNPEYRCTIPISISNSKFNDQDIKNLQVIPNPQPKAK